MRLENTDLLILYIIPALVFLFFWFSINSRKNKLEKIIRKDFVKELVPGISFGKLWAKAVMVTIAVFFAVTALLRPQWGYQWEEVTRKGLDILIAIDTSKSMLAEDVKPNRLERSKLAIKDLVKKLNGGDRIGLIAFAGTAFLQCPLTVDYNGFILSLNDVDTQTIPRGGTSISSAIQEATRSYEGGLKKNKILIIITDGEDHEGDPVKMAEFAKSQGITIFTIGVGTKEGELIPNLDDGAKGFLKDRKGDVVRTSLDEATLQKIALMSGGAYVRSSISDFGLDYIYREKLSRFEKREVESKMKKRFMDRFQVPLALALFFFVIDALITDRRRTVLEGRQLS